MKIQKEVGCSCPGAATTKEAKPRSYPLLLGILIAIIPKCPFCVLAYSSALTLCNGSNFYMHQSGWTSWLSIGLAAFTLIMVLVNYRGTRTLIAAGLIILGSVLIIRAELYTGQLQVYYTGVVFIFSGIWTNASMLYFARFVIRVLLRISPDKLRNRISQLAHQTRIL